MTGIKNFLKNGLGDEVGGFKARLVAPNPAGLPNPAGDGQAGLGCGPFTEAHRGAGA